jgi:uracil-DNA glycosylase family protein
MKRDCEKNVTAATFLPNRRTLPELQRASKTCRGCDLYKHATQTVFGQGSKGAKLLIVGEQPGNSEDLEGAPFIGPAGKLLDRALAEAGVERADAYVTNAVKHFKFVVRGKSRIHQKPKITEIRACRPWLEAELAAVKPQLVLCLGKTASEAVLQREVGIQKERGKLYRGPGDIPVILTVHPSGLLRIPDPAAREEAYREFVKDLKRVRALLKRNL